MSAAVVLRRGILAAALLGLLLPAACAPDYSAVRDWSATGREAVLPPVPARPLATPAAGAPRPAPITATGRQGAIQAAREAAAAWLGLLAWVADDGLPPSRVNLLEPHAAALRPFDAEGAEAVLQLGEAMAFGARRNWRAPQLRVAVARGDAPFRGVLAVLGRLLPQDAPEQATLTHLAEGHTLLLERAARLAAPETARLLRLQESELRRLMAPGG
jgi:hypothetical protein